MLAKVLCGTIIGIDGLLIQVEVDISRGLPAFDIVGLPDTAVRESRERVRSAIKNSGYEFPVQRITINLAPGNIKKIGPHYDLAIAVGVLSALGLVPGKKSAKLLYIGELSLSGGIRKVNGVLPMVMAARQKGIRDVIVPAGNYEEASVVEGINVFPARNLREVVNYLNDVGTRKVTGTKSNKKDIKEEYDIDLAEVKGQHEAKRALEVAAAGRHNMLFFGPPGSGKTMLARRLRTILPPLTVEEALEITKIYSVVGMQAEYRGLMARRPFRSPHHSISTAGLIGGGKTPEPGEISLAHHGTLFLDELPEFRRDVLEILRQPLEEGKITIVRRNRRATFPANFMLVAAMNPCPCGFYGDDKHECKCSTTSINRYRGKISGPLLDRIDIQLEISSLSFEEMTGNDESQRETSRQVRERVCRIQELQIQRYQKDGITYNSQLKGKLLKKYCPLDKEGKILLQGAIERLGLSARGYDRILRLARTIADLDHKERIRGEHIAEAIQYRGLDRKLF